MNKKYLHKVVDQLISETEIDWRDIKSSSYGRDTNRRNTIRVQSFFYDADFFHLFSDPDPEENYFFNRYFTKHCREVYGLNDDEVDYVWKEYINSIIYTIKTKDNLNEARISSKLNSDYLDEVAQYLIDNTVIIPDKTISVSHKKSKRGKIIIPVKDNIELEYYYNHLVNPSIVLLFSDEMENVYGLDPGLEIKYVWDKYKKHIFSNI